MPVINLGHWHSFPCPHPLDFAGAEKELVAEADAVLAMEVVDLAGALRSAGAGDGRDPTVIGVSMDELLQHSLTTDYQGLPAVDLSILSSSASALPLLIEECRRLIDGSARERIDRRRQALQARQAELRARQRRYLEEQWDHPQISEARLVAELWQVIQKEDFVFTQGRVRRMAPGVCYLPGPECVVAGGGGGAVGSGPGVALGAALALKGTGKVPVAVMGDGEFLSSIQALWTGAHYRIPSLWVINNNRSYFNDEDHQDRVARRRNRPPENRWIAMRVEGPEIDFAAAVRPFGVVGEGPVKRAEDLGPALRRALDAVKQGQLAVVDVRTENRTRG
jgi:thiamine pyrophosphate-dependent acetolactate synthase large subunit-like protein